MPMYAKSSSKRKRSTSAVAKKRPRTTIMKVSRELPFPPVKEFCFLYETELTLNSNALSGSSNMLVAPNSLYDFDRTLAAYFKDKQPLYYDTLLTSDGPYKRYFVHHWDIYYTVINAVSVPLTVIKAGPTTNSADIDSFTEVMSYPGAQIRHVEASGAANSKIVIHSKGNVRDAAGVTDRDDKYTADWVSAPTNTIYESLTVHYPGYTSGTWGAYVSVSAKLYATLSGADAKES